MDSATDLSAPPDPAEPGRRRRAGLRQETRERLIRCGTELLTEQGFASTGIDLVLKRVGVPKGSFYHYFASKEDFGSAVIDHYAAYFANKLDRCFGDDTRPPLARLRAFVDEAAAGMARHGFRRGCLIGNLGQELGAANETYRDRLEAVFRDWQARLERCLEAARACGELRADADCERLAAFFWIGWEGAVLRAKLTASAEPLELFASGFFAALPIASDDAKEK